MLTLIVIILILIFIVFLSCLIISVRADEEMIEIIRKADEEEIEWNEYY